MCFLIFFSLCSRSYCSCSCRCLCGIVWFLRWRMDVVVCCHLGATGVSALEAPQKLPAVLGLCQGTVPSGVVQNCTLLGEELSAWPGIPFIRVILLSVCVLSVWWGTDFRKNRCSYACKLQQCWINFLQKSLKCQVYFEKTWTVNFTKCLKLPRQILRLRSSFSVLFTE